MSTNVNNGNQERTLYYHQQVKSKDFNKINYKLHLPGIYVGGDLTKVSTSTVSINPFVCVYNEDTEKLAIRIETLEQATVAGVNVVHPWIIGRYVWSDSENNYMEFLAVDFASIQASDLIFGYAEFDGSTLLTTFDYTRKSLEGAYYYKLQETPFKVIADEPYSNSVIVKSGGPYFFNSRWVELSSNTTSPEVEFPISSFGRTDMVVIDSLDNSVKIIKGSDTSIEATVVDTQYMVVGIIHLPADETSIVKGNYIEYIHPSRNLSSADTAVSLLEKIKPVDGSGSGIIAQYLGGYDKEYYRDKINTAITENVQFTQIVKPSYIVDVFFVNGTYFGFPRNGTNQYATSNDGISWIQRTLPSTVTSTYWVIAGSTNNSTIILVPAYNVNATLFATSTDGGISWVPRSLPAAAFWTSIIAGSGIGFILSASGFGPLFFTLYGLSFISISAAFPTKPAGSIWGTPVFQNGKFLSALFYSNGTPTYMSAVSTNGTTWTEGVLPNTKCRYVAGNGVFIALQGTDSADSTNHYISSDAINWTPYSGLPATQWEEYTYGGGQFVLRGVTPSRKFIYMSETGKTWVRRPTPASFPECGTIACGNNLIHVYPYTPYDYSLTLEHLYYLE